LPEGCGGESVNSKPVVIACQPLLRDLVLYGFRLIHHHRIQAGGIRWDPVGPGKLMKKSSPDSIFFFLNQILTIYNFFRVTGKESAVIGFKKKVQSDRENLSYTIFFKDASS